MYRICENSSVFDQKLCWLIYCFVVWKADFDLKFPFLNNVDEWPKEIIFTNIFFCLIFCMLMQGGEFSWLSFWGLLQQELPFFHICHCFSPFPLTINHCEIPVISSIIQTPSCTHSLAYMHDPRVDLQCVRFIQIVKLSWGKCHWCYVFDIPQELHGWKLVTRLNSILMCVKLSLLSLKSDFQSGLFKQE